MDKDKEEDAPVRKWNGRVYWIITDIDNGSEFLVSQNKNAKFKDCKVCDMPCNFTLATPQEIQCGHRSPSVEILRDCDIPPNTIILER